MRNAGIELNIDTRNLSPASKFQWNTNFNMSYNQNLITQLPNGGRTIVAGYNDVIFTRGMPIYTFKQMVYERVITSLDQIPVYPLTGQRMTSFFGPLKLGDPLWTDANKDGTAWGDDDMVPTGNPNPKFTGGFNNTLIYGDFSLSIGCAFALDRDIINTNLRNQFDGWMFDGNNVAFATRRIPDLTKLDIWQPQHGKTDAELANYNPRYPAVNPGGPGYFYYFYPLSSAFNENGSYLKVTNISLGYRLPKKVLESLKISSFRAYAMLDNVYTFQNSTVPNVEQVDPFGNYSGGSYPIPKKITLGVTVQF